MSKKITLEEAQARMCEAMKDIDNFSDAMRISFHLIDFYIQLENENKLPRRLQLIYYAAAFVIFEYLYDNGAFKQEGNFPEYIRKNVISIISKGSNNYDKRD